MPREKTAEHEHQQTAWERAYEYALDRGNSEKAARHYANNFAHEFEGADYPKVDPDQAETNRANAKRAELEAQAIRDAHSEGDGQVETTMIGGPSRGQAPLTQTREQQIAEAREVLRRYGVAD